MKQNDAVIDEGLDEISNSLDTLTSISQAMNEEARTQTSKLEKLSGSMDKVADTKCCERQTQETAQVVRRLMNGDDTVCK